MSEIDEFYEAKQGKIFPPSPGLRQFPSDLPPRLKLTPYDKLDYAHYQHTKYKMTAGDRVIEFCQTLRVPSGRDVGKLVVLPEFQRNMIKAIYDPIDPITGFRSIREAVITMARKNGKTTLAAMLVLAHLVGPLVQRNGEMYSAGFRRDQAEIIWMTLYQIISVDDELSFFCTWSRTRKTVDCGKFGTRYKSISAEAKSKHGFNPVFVVLDELAQFGTDRSLYDVFKTAGGAQDESLLLTISTQAADDLAIMSELIDYGRDVELGEVIDKSFKLIEYFTDDYADIYDEKNWITANPAWNDFRNKTELRQMAERANKSPSAEATFRNLYLNQRTASTVALVSPSVWRLNGAAPQNITIGRQAVLALDLSDTLDFTCLMVLLPDNDANMIDVLPIFFTPADTIDERSKRDRVDYKKWVNMGMLIATPGKAISYRYVARKFIDLFEDFEVLYCAFDRWRVKLFKANLELEGFSPDSVTWIEHGQGYKDMGPAIDVTEETLLSNRLRHGMHPVLTFCMGSTKVSKDPAGNRKFDKLRSSGKIDGTVALAMGLNALNQNSPEGARSVYERRAPVAVPMMQRDTVSQLPTVRSVWQRMGGY